MADSAPTKLAEVLESLQPADRQKITAWLLGGLASGRLGDATSDDLPRAVLVSQSSRRRRPSDLLEFSGGPLASGEEHQVVTLRLPQERHAELREWCTDHGFSMAAVLRGLVDRFLEDQRRVAGRAAEDGPES